MGALGFSLGVRARGSRILNSGAFDPRSLFADGAPGAWYDPGDPATLFQDADGTIAGVPDAPVGRMLDRSGRGNAVTQGAAASRPLLKRDPDGRRYLLFDGADDWLGSMAAELRFTGPMTLAVAMRRGVSGLTDVWVSAQTHAANVNPYELRTDPSGTAELVASGAGAFERTSAGPGMGAPAGADVVITAARTGSAIDFTVGAGATSPPHVTVPTSDAETEFRLGSRKGIPMFANGRIYGALVIGRLLAPAEKAALRAWLSAAAGIAA